MLTVPAAAVLALGSGAGSGGGAGIPVRELILVAATGALVTYLSTGVIRVIAIKWGAVAVPRERDVHAVPTPRLGGVAIYLGYCAAVVLAAQLPALNRGFSYTPDMWATVIAGAVIVAVGVIDDRWGVDALTKFLGQITAAGVLVLTGVSWFIIYVPGVGTVTLDQLQSGLLTIVIVAVTVNAVNFIDGLDGLAAGVGAIAALAICLFSLGMLRDAGGDVSVYAPAMMAAILAGVCVGFLPHNFQPARVFMGDSGAMFIGLVLAAAATSASGRAPNAYGTTDMFTLLLPVILAVAVVFVPGLDLIMAVVRRVRAGMNPFAADKMHLHHRLLELGHSQRRVVLVIYLWVAVLALSAAASAVFEPHVVAPIWAGGLLVALVITIVPRLRARLRPVPAGKLNGRDQTRVNR